MFVRVHGPSHGRPCSQHVILPQHFSNFNLQHTQMPSSPFAVLVPVHRFGPFCGLSAQPYAYVVARKRPVPQPLSRGVQRRVGV